MMKKNGFTLAEVLITLAIIGVVATMTLPALMTNTAEQQAKTGLRKGINTLTEAAQMNNALDGFDYSSLTDTTTNDTEALSLYALLANRAAVDFQKSKTGAQPSSMTNNSGNFTMFFRDGASLSFLPSDTAASKDHNKIRLEDGLPKGFGAIYDYNGTKKPNQLSNCLGTTGGLASGKDSTALTKTACTKANRVIKDQFGVRLRGSYAVPNGAAARWAFEE